MCQHDQTQHDRAQHDQVDHSQADHEHAQVEGEVPALPGNPSLAQLRTRAKGLRRGASRGNPADLATIRDRHPDGGRLAGAPGSITLRDAQLALARSLGLPGWQALVQAVGRNRVEERDLHRWFGVELNNEVWSLIEDGIDADSPQADRDLVLYGAYASARHWQEVGNQANAARGEHLISRAATAVGLPEVGLRHARNCLALVQEHADEMADWDAPFAHEALARALAGTGDLTGGAEHRAIAAGLTGRLADPADRTILLTELARQPWFGLDG